MNTNNSLKATTLSVHNELIDRIKIISEKLRINTDEIILYCINRYCQEKGFLFKYDSLTTYQPRCNMYKAFHINLPQVLYEKCFDLRKASKLSLSFIFAIAFSLYSHELEEDPKTVKTEELTDCYRQDSYQIRVICQKDLVSFLYMWKEPPKKQ